MLDQLERQWHTASITAAIRGGEVEEWAEVQQRFEEYLSGEVRPLTEEEQRRKLLGLT